ncbi:MAG TPA: mRNA surveillance protein pelota [Nanoarchaeota archaeon]|nr:mRNA surveillance protein pelota [Nanoarchaeota archaeon]
MWYNVKEKAVKLRIEAPEEIFFIKHFITPHSYVTAETIRSKEIIRDGRKIKVGKEKIKLTIEVEKIEIKENGLKILGKIVESSKETKGYHSLVLSVGSEAIIKKDWKNWEIEKLRKLIRPCEKVLVCVMDEKEAEIFIIGDVIEEKGKIYSGFFKAHDSSLKTRFFSEISKAIKDWEGKIILAGPGFAKEEFFKYLKENLSEIKSRKVFVDSISHTGMAGVNELLKRGTLKRILKETRISEEAKEIEKFFEEIAKEGLAVYGAQEVKKAIELGALEKLLISTKLIEKYKELLDQAEKIGAKIMLISDSHPEGERFYHFCGIGGFLRFRM